MRLTVAPNDDGTLDITRDGTTVTYDEDDVDRCGLTGAEKMFLRSMFRHAVPWPASCPVPPGGST